MELLTDRVRGGSENWQGSAQSLQSQKLEVVGRLAGSVAHDFNNLLLALRGHGELALLRLERGDGGAAAGDVREMLFAADRAAELIRQLLAFARGQVMCPAVLDLNEVVAEMDRLLQRLLGEDVVLLASCPDEPVLVTADRSQLEQVIVNLAVNARDAMPRGGRLAIEVSKVAGEGAGAAQCARLAVIDSGVGMDAGTAARIFEPFFTTKGEHGTGLGLATVSGIVRQSGGQITVESKPGGGTTFEIDLPLSTGAPALARGAETILVVEDEPDAGSAVRGMLEAGGYSVIVVESGEQALETITRSGRLVDLVLTDLIMRGLHGREMGHRIRELRPGIKVLYTSGYTDDNLTRRGGLPLGTDFIQKPFSGEQLTWSIRQLLDLKLASPPAITSRAPTATARSSQDT